MMKDTNTCPKCAASLTHNWQTQTFTINELRARMNLNPSSKRDADTTTVTREVCFVQCECGFDDFRVRLTMEAKS